MALAAIAVAALLLAAPQDQMETAAAADHLNIPGYDGESPGSSLELEIAPQIVSHNPLGAGSQASDALDLSLTLATRHRISSALELELDAGASKTIDNDDGSSSALGATIELRTVPGTSGLSAFASYTVARDYDGFLEQGLDTSQTFTAGLRYGRSLGGAEIGFELAPRWVESSFDLDDHVAVNLWGELVVPVLGEGVSLILDTSVERRWYGNEGPLLLAKRRDWRFASYLGLDFAGAVNAAAGIRFVRALGVGVEWLEVGSNFDGADRSNLSFLPAVAVGLSF